MVPPPPPPASEKRASKQKPSGGRTSGCGYDCGLCDQKIPPLQIRKHYGAFFHVECVAAIRARHRLLPPEEKRRDRGEFEHQPEVFKLKALPFVKEPGEKRNPDARLQLKRSLQVVSTGTELSRTSGYGEDDLLLNITRFGRFHSWWDGWDEAKCNQEFEKLYAEQRGRYDRDGERVVACKDWLCCKCMVRQWEFTFRSPQACPTLCKPKINQK